MTQELVAQQNNSSSGLYNTLAKVWITAQKKFKKYWLLLQILQGIHISIDNVMKGHYSTDSKDLKIKLLCHMHVDSNLARDIV